MNDEQLLRYSRQIMLPQIDVAGQELLLAARVLIIGLGGLGCPAALYLAGSGVGTLLLADDDNIDISNLQRQIAHGSADIGSPKSQSVASAVSQLNTDIKVETVNQRLNADNLPDFIKGADLVLDCTDSLDSRQAINSAALQFQIPVVSGAAIRMEGQVSVFDYRDPAAPCYECLYGNMTGISMKCSENGVLGPLVGIIGAMQALEAVKLITGTGTSLAGRLLLLDAMSMQWRELRLQKKKDCPVCGL